MVDTNSDFNNAVFTDSTTDLKLEDINPGKVFAIFNRETWAGVEIILISRDLRRMKVIMVPHEKQPKNLLYLSPCLLEEAKRRRPLMIHIPPENVIPVFSSGPEKHKKTVSMLLRKSDVKRLDKKDV